jgi:membrane protein DedA with SNARE-associated domain
MTILINNLISYLNEVSGVLLYLFFIISTLVENIFPPWPSDTLIVFSGFLASKGIVTIQGAFITSWLGNVLGGLIMYYFGARILKKTRRIQQKTHVPKGILEKIFHFASHESLVEARRLFEKYGVGFVLISRFFPGIRFFVSILAGIYAMNPIQYIISFAAGSFIWGILLVYAGYILGTQWENALQWLKYYNTFATFILVFLIAVFVLFLKKKELIKKYFYRKK